MGSKVVLVFPNSPDLNVLDLGFLNTIQCIQHQYEPKNMEKLVEMIEICFNRRHWTKMNNNLLKLHRVIKCIILCDSNNNYKMTHTSKEKFERIDQLPTSIKILDEVKAKL